MVSFFQFCVQYNVVKHASHFNYVEILSSRQLWNKYELFPMDFPFIPRKVLGMTVTTLNFNKSSFVHFDPFQL